MGVATTHERTRGTHAPVCRDLSLWETFNYDEPTLPVTSDACTKAVFSEFFSFEAHVQVASQIVDHCRATACD